MYVVSFLFCKLPSFFLSSNCQRERLRTALLCGVSQNLLGGLGMGSLFQRHCRFSACPDRSIIQGCPALSRAHCCKDPLGLTSLLPPAGVYSGKKVESHCKPQHHLSYVMLVVPNQRGDLWSWFYQKIPRRNSFWGLGENSLQVKDKSCTRQLCPTPNPCTVNAVVINTRSEISFIK